MKNITPTFAQRAFGKTFLPLLLVLAGVILAAAGIWRGEIKYVFQKAVAICLECMGIG